MGSGRIQGMVMGVIVIVIAAIMMPMVFTGITSLQAENITNFTGLEDVSSASALVIIAMVFFGGGWMTFSAARGKNYQKSDLMNVIYGLLTLYIGLILFPIIITQFNTLYPVSAAFDAEGIVAVVPLVLYVGFIFGGGWFITKGAGIRRGGKKKNKVKAY